MVLSILSQTKNWSISSACLSLVFFSSLYADAPKGATPPDPCHACTFWFKPDPQDKQNGLSTSVSILAFKPFVDDLWFANYQYGSMPGDPPAVALQDLDILLRGQLKRARYGWDPGLRFTFGYNIGKNAPKVNFEYTYFDGGGTQVARENPNEVYALQPLFFPPTTSTVDWGQIASHLDLTMNQADLTSYLPCFTTCHSRMDFLFGIRGLWIKQNWHINATPSTYSGNSITTPFLIENNWSYSAGGLQVGLAYEIDMVRGFNFHFLGAGFTTVGTYHMKYFTEDQPEGLTAARARTSETRFIPGYRFLTGLSWKHCLENFSFGLGFDWEINGFVDLHETFPFFLPSGTDLSAGTWQKSSVIVQGFLISAGIDF